MCTTLDPRDIDMPLVSDGRPVIAASELPPISHEYSINPLAMIKAAIQLPKTHVVLTHYEGGKVERHETRSLATAENWAIGERRKIGRNLISRETGSAVRVIAVEVESL